MAVSVELEPWDVRQRIFCLVGLAFNLQDDDDDEDDDDDDEREWEARREVQLTYGLCRSEKVAASCCEVSSSMLAFLTEDSKSANDHNS